MKRLSLTPRAGWEDKVKELGLVWSSPEGKHYWNESAAYSFTMDQILEIEKATAECYQLLIEAGQVVIDNQLLGKFGIPTKFHGLIRETWDLEPPALNYGRFDFGYDGINPPKMLEFNCDTPASLLEGSIVQWLWKEEVFPNNSQFNTIHEALVARWKAIRNKLPFGCPLHFTVYPEPSGEDEVTTGYLMDTAKEAGFEDIVFLPIDQIGWDGEKFVDLDERWIQALYKFYPWEWIVKEEFAENILRTGTHWIEPIWKMIWSNKAILPILSDLAPNHPNILKASYEPPLSGPASYVKKPFLSREGNNIEIVKSNRVLAKSEGDYTDSGHVYQELFDLPCFDGGYPIIGSWVVDGEPCGMGIREGGLITDDLARFIPHVIEG